MSDDDDNNSGQDTIITSVDPGSTNCGIAKYSVAQDRFLFLGLADLRTSRAGDIVDRLHEYMTVTEPESFSGTNLVVVERQMGTVVRNMCLEAAIRTRWRGQCICVAPQAVMRHYGIPSGISRQEKKKEMVGIVKAFLTTRERAMAERVVEKRRAANRQAKQDHKNLLLRIKQQKRKRKRIPKLNLPFPTIKFDDIYEAAAQALWAAEEKLGHKVKRRRRQRRRRRRRRRKQTTLSTAWNSPSPPPPPPLPIEKSVIVID